MGKKDGFVKYCYVVSLCALVMCETPDLAKGTLRCSRIKVYDSELKELMDRNGISE